MSRGYRAVRVRCVSCGLESVGVRHPDGRVYPSDRARPEPDDPTIDGYCIPCYEGARSPRKENR